MEKFIFYDKIYEKSDLLKLEKMFLTSTWQVHENNTAKRKYISIEDYLNPNTIIEKYLAYLSGLEACCLHDGLMKCSKYFSDVKIAKYDEGDEFNWHCDHWPEEHMGIHIKRQLASITYLNDDFEGGETEFSCGIIIKPEVGKTLVFPANWCFPHRGKVVTKGTKYIYVSHIWA